MSCKSQCLIHIELRYLTYSVVSVSPQCYWDIIGALLVSTGQGCDTITDPVLSETNNPSLSSLQTIRLLDPRPNSCCCEQLQIH